MYYASYNEGVMKNPDYANLMIKDVYVQPLSLEVPGEFEQKDITYIDKGNEAEIKGMKVKFIDFDRSKFNNMQDGEHSEDDGHNHANIMGAQLEITKDGKSETVLVEQVVAEKPQYMPSQTKINEDLMLYLADINVEGTPKIGLAVVDTKVPKDEVPETLVVTAAVKPFISLVWIGTLVMVGGFFLSMIYRYKGLFVRTNINKQNKMEEISENVIINGNGNYKKKQKTKVLS
jgi:cytochrome c-type biogenesis protein CcmF